MKRAWAGLLDLIYPRVCHGCGASADGSHSFCWECLSEMQYVQPPFCSHCGDPVPGHIDHEYLCVYCARKTPYFDGARSAVRYEGAVRQAVMALKYQQSTWLTIDLTEMLDACLRTHYDLFAFDAVCYVPLQSVKRRERGFNQAELLARRLAAQRNWPVVGRALKRVKWTTTQTKLTAAQRASNVKGAFSVDRPEGVDGKRLLLVDDVMTTGATVNDCARALKEVGAASVHVVTVARG